MTPMRALAMSGAAAAVLLAGVLSGCQATPDPQASSPAPATPSGEPSPETTIPGPTIPEPSPAGSTPPAVTGAEPISLDCDVLVPPSAIYAFNTGFGLLHSWTPPSGSLGARAVASSGVACRWVSGSGGAVLDVSAAHPSSTELAALESWVSSGSAAPYGEESWFDLDAAGRGQLVIIANGTWLSVVSDYLGEAGDADGIVDAAMSALGMD